MPLLDIQGLRTVFQTDAGPAPAVDGVSFSLDAGKTLGLVGESGCGKSVTALSIMRLIASPPGRIADGRIEFDGRDLLPLAEPDMRKLRGNDIGMIFQEPQTSLNPVFTVGSQIAEALIIHKGLSRPAARKESIELLHKVGIPAPDTRYDAYPHHLSGGMKQRVMIAMAISCQPKLLIADEPTTALDVTIQAQILDLLNSLQQDFGMAILLITHDLGVVAEVADTVAVMYAGQIVETAPVRELFANPRHPYTIGLFDSLPSLTGEPTRLKVIEGTVPEPTHFPTGCRFAPRCPFVTAPCETAPPEPEVVEDGHTSRCIRWREVRQG